MFVIEEARKKNKKNALKRIKIESSMEYVWRREREKEVNKPFVRMTWLSIPFTTNPKWQ